MVWITFICHLAPKCSISALLVVPLFPTFLISLDPWVVFHVEKYSLIIRSLFKDGLVFAVEFSHRSGRDLLNVAKKRTNIIPIIEDARHPHKYRMLIGECDRWRSFLLERTILNLVLRVSRYGRHHLCRCGSTGSSAYPRSECASLSQERRKFRHFH